MICHWRAVKPINPLLEGTVRHAQLDGGFASDEDGSVDHLTVFSEVLAQKVLMNVEDLVFIVAMDFDDFRPHVEVDHVVRGSLYERLLSVR